MNDDEYQKKIKALNKMLNILHSHQTHFSSHDEWSPECQNAIDGLRIANKCQALVAHDRVLLDRD